MLERLNNALLECEAEKTAIETRDDEQAICEEVAAFETEVRASYAEKKQSELVDKDYEIKALKNLIAKEEALIASKAAEEAEVVESSVEVNETAEAFQG